VVALHLLHFQLSIPYDLSLFYGIHSVSSTQWPVWHFHLHWSWALYLKITTVLHMLWWNSTVANITSANSETESDCLLMVFASSCCSLLNTVVKHKLNYCNCGILLQVSLIYVIPYPDFSKNKVYLYYFTSICIKKDSMTGMNTRC